MDNADSFEVQTWRLRGVTCWLMVLGISGWALPEVTWSEFALKPWSLAVGSAALLAGLLAWRTDVLPLARRVTWLAAVTSVTLILSITQICGVLDAENTWGTLVASATWATIAIVLTLGMARIARAEGNNTSRRRWRAAFLGTSILIGVKVSLLILALSLSAIRGEPTNLIPRGFGVLVITAVISYVPLLLFIRAMVFTSIDFGQQGGMGPKALAFVAQPRGMVVIVLLWLVPTWTILPTQWHYWTTPTFDEFVRANAGRARLDNLPPTVTVVRSIWEDNKSLTGNMTEEDEDGAPPSGLVNTSGIAKATITHGTETLANLVFCVTAQWDKKTAELKGTKVEWERQDCDPRFSVLARAAFEPNWKPASVDPDEPDLPDSKRWALPIRLEVCLVSGEEHRPLEIVQAENLPFGYRELAEEEKASRQAMRKAMLEQLDSMSFTGQSENIKIEKEATLPKANLPAIQAPSRFSFPDPPAAGEGIVYRATIEGCILFLMKYDKRTYYDHDKPIPYTDTLWLPRPRNAHFDASSNYDEYSFHIDLELKGLVRSAGSTVSSSRTASQKTDHRLDGETW